MRFFQRGKEELPMAAKAVQTAPPLSPLYEIGGADLCMEQERRLYAALRGAVPIINAALEKIERLTGAFTVICKDQRAQDELDEFLREVPVNAGQRGMAQFINSHFDQLLTFGTAVGDIVMSRDGEEIAALYNADLDDVEIRYGRTPLETCICRKDRTGEAHPVRHPEFVMATLLNPPPGKLYGVSVMRGLPLISSILLKIYRAIGMNWERVGNVRFAVTYKPSGEGDRAFAKERAQQIAGEWSRAMRSNEVSDFVSVGDVNIKVIGADNQILNSEVPVRQLLEQIVAKLGIPPFLLGLSWSSTERMSMQQADILTSELEAYRRLLTPVVNRICSLWLRLHGYSSEHTVEWENINLQDELDLANARLLNAQAEQIEAEEGERK